MRRILVCLVSLGSCVALANNPGTEALDSGDGPVIQAVLDTFAAAWLAGDRAALERVLHEEYAYFTAPEADAKSWDRDTEIGFAGTMAQSGTVRSLTATATGIEKGATAGEVSVRVRLDSGLVLAEGDSTRVSTEMQFVLRQDSDGALRVWRQVDRSGPKQ